MMIDCVSLQKSVVDFLKNEIANCKKVRKSTPSLAIVLVGNNPASKVYVSRKTKLAEEIGISCNLFHFEENAKESDVLSQIALLNEDENCHGIIVQLPLPSGFDKDKILFQIAPTKDVDGLHPFNIGLLNYTNALPYSITNCDLSFQNRKLGENVPFIPCTPLGCLYVIQQNTQTLAGKNVVIFGNSNLVGKPLSRILMLCGATVTTLHTKSVINEDIIQNADIIVLATGVEITLPSHLKTNVIIVDVGIRLNNENKIIGDLNYSNINTHNALITPVPNGIGRMTVASLVFNAFLAWKNK
ncbi:MAG: Methylenetetrahydrofolate dehydrogenase [Pseudomonadota bacterium]|jgi:methylenetetrahydrofolate dehydrogenase (NADP+)/methenyltetrahydrofolate cyclohydrolase